MRLVRALGDARSGRAAVADAGRTARAKLNGYLEDHAFLLEALLSLYEATFEPRWFSEARAVADFTIAHFADDERGGFFETADYHERLLARRKDLEDNPIPAGNSSMAYGLLRLAALTGEYSYEERAVGVFRLLHKIAFQHPAAFAHLLQAIDFWRAPVKEVALVGDDVRPLERVVRARFRPHLVLAGGPADGVPLLEGRSPVDGQAAAYVCEHFACKRPVTSPDELEALLDGLTARRAGGGGFARALATGRAERAAKARPDAEGRATPPIGARAQRVRPHVPTATRAGPQRPGSVSLARDRPRAGHLQHRSIRAIPDSPAPSPRAKTRTPRRPKTGRSSGVVNVRCWDGRVKDIGPPAARRSSPAAADKVLERLSAAPDRATQISRPAPRGLVLTERLDNNSPDQAFPNDMR